MLSLAYLIPCNTCSVVMYIIVVVCTCYLDKKAVNIYPVHSCTRYTNPVVKFVRQNSASQATHIETTVCLAHSMESASLQK